MANISYKKNYDERARMPADILNAARVGDLLEADRALKEDPECYKKTDGFGRDALKLAIINLHEEFGKHILMETPIRASEKDREGSSSLDYALKYSNNTLGIWVYKKWAREDAEEQGLVYYYDDPENADEEPFLEDPWRPKP